MTGSSTASASFAEAPGRRRWTRSRRFAPEVSKKQGNWRSGWPSRQSATALADLRKAASFTRRDFSEPSGVTADGGWLPPKGIRFSRSGSMSSQRRGRPMSRVASSCSAICPRGTANSPRIGARPTAAAAWGLSKADCSITATPSIFIRLTSSGSWAPIGPHAGGMRRWRGSRPGASTRSAIGATPVCGRCTGCPTRCRFRSKASTTRSPRLTIGGARCRIRSAPALLPLRTRWRATPQPGFAAIPT